MISDTAGLSGSGIKSMNDCHTPFLNNIAFVIAHVKTWQIIAILETQREHMHKAWHWPGGRI